MIPPSDQPRVCVLGSIILDLVVNAPRLPKPGETVFGGAVRRHAGGKGANQAVAASRMGCAVCLVGTVGDDDDGRAMLHAISHEAVDVAHIAVESSQPTGTAVVSVAADGNNTIIVSPGANMALTSDRVAAARAAIAAADVLAIQLEVPIEAALTAASLARDAGTTVLLNAAPVPPGGVAAELLAATDVLIVNESEAAAMAPDQTGIDAALARLASLGPRVVVATLGERGVRYMAECRAPIGVEAFPVHAVDSTGAGDAFVGAFATRWAEQQIGGALDAMGVMDAVCWGVAAGALATTQHGAIPSMPRRKDVVDLLRSGSRPGAGS